MADLFDVIADPTRREILHALRTHADDEGGEVSVGRLVSELPLSQPTVSKHLKTLRETGLVTVREQGQHRYYRLEAGALAPVSDWIASLLPPPAHVGSDVHGADPIASDPDPAPVAPASLRVAAARAGAFLARRAAALGVRL